MSRCNRRTGQLRCGEGFLKALLAISGLIDGLSRRIGTLATWLVLLAALLSAFNALARYSVGALLAAEARLGGGLAWLFDLYRNNSNLMSDLQIAMFAAMVMLGAPLTLQMNEHVRVDAVYGSLGSRARSWIDLVGGLLFLVPMCVLMIHFTWPWFLEAWTVNEMSQNAGGLPRWPAKLMLPLGFALVLLQGLSEIIKCIADLTGVRRRDQAYEKPLQ